MNGIAARRLVEDPAPLAEGPAPRARVSVVMVVYRTGEALDQSLTCVLADPLVDEFVVVDNGSTAEEARRLQAVAARDARLVVISGHGNIGFARGANLGARRARGERLVFLNPDAFLQGGCIAALVAAIEGQPVPCVVGGRVLNADGTEQRGGRRGEITPLSALLSLSGLARRVPALQGYEVHWEAETLPTGALPTPTISGACFCMRREDFDVMGGFDEGYFLHVEDVDLCWRVRRQGGAVLFHPGAEVVHIGGTSRTSPLKVEFHKGVGLARFFRKRAIGLTQTAAALALTPLVIAAALARPVLRRLRPRSA